MSYADDPQFVADVHKVLADVLGLPGDFMDYTVQYAALNPLSIPISQVSGFTQFAPNVAARVSTLETTNSASYVNLSTSGPELSHLPNGKYMILFGSGFNTSAGIDTCSFSVSINGATALDADGASQSASSTATYWPTVSLDKTLSSGNSNSLKMQYRTTGAQTGQFFQRWLIAVKYANA